MKRVFSGSADDEAALRDALLFQIGRCYASVMEIQFSPEQEAQLSRIAAHAGTDPADVVKRAALQLVEENARYLTAVEEGIAQADRGQMVDDDVVKHWIEQRERA